MKIVNTLQQMPASYIRDILDVANSPDVTSLAGGLLANSAFPVHLMSNSFEKMLTTPEVFQYGNTIGYGPLIDYLSKTCALPKTHKLMISSGAQQGLDLIARAYIEPGDTVVMEAPSYLGARQVFELSQANIVTVSQNEQGPDLIALENSFKCDNPKIFYSVPDFHNPTGICWSLAVRQKVGELCEKYNVTLLEDAPYRDLRFSGEALPLASSFCVDNAIVLQSFSKTCAPSLRVGAVYGKADFIEPLIKVKQSADLHSSIPMQVLLLDLLQHEDYPAHLDNIRSQHKVLYTSLTVALEKYLPSECSFYSVEGGMFVWVTIPHCNTFELAQALLAEKVAVVPSSVFYPQDKPDHSAIRLNFTNSSVDDIESAVKCLGKVVAAKKY